MCDGIIAPGYLPEALEILKNKKKGSFIVLEGNPNFSIPEMEFRELHGLVLAQKHNEVRIILNTVFIYKRLFEQHCNREERIIRKCNQ